MALLRRRDTLCSFEIGRNVQALCDIARLAFCHDTDVTCNGWLATQFDLSDAHISSSGNDDWYGEHVRRIPVSMMRGLGSLVGEHSEMPYGHQSAIAAPSFTPFSHIEQPYFPKS